MLNMQNKKGCERLCSTETKIKKGSRGGDINSNQLNNEGALIAVLIITSRVISRCWPQLE